MNIEKKQGDLLSLTLGITIEPADYADRVKKSLNDYRRNAEIKGFRKGMVPMGLIQKMHGRTALLDEVNKLMSEGVNKYIEENQIKMIGEPLPNDELQPKIDWDQDEAFTFVFDLMLTPKVELTLGADDHIFVKEPKILKKDKDDYIAAVRKEHGDHELNQEFFDLVLGAGQADSIEVFTKKIEERMRLEFSSASDYRLTRDAQDYVVDKSAIELPDALLKRWLFQINDGKFSLEEIERDYSAFARDFRWQLVRGYLMQENKIQIAKEEMMDQAVRIAQYRFAMYGLTSVPQEHLQEYAQKILSDEKESHRIFEMIEDDKVVGLIRSKVTLDSEKISFSKMRELNAPKAK